MLDKATRSALLELLETERAVALLQSDGGILWKAEAHVTDQDKVDALTKGEVLALWAKGDDI